MAPPREVFRAGKTERIVRRRAVAGPAGQRPRVLLTEGVMARGVVTLRDGSGGWTGPGRRAACGGIRPQAGSRRASRGTWHGSRVPTRPGPEEGGRGGDVAGALRRAQTRGPVTARHHEAQLGSPVCRARLPPRRTGPPPAPPQAARHRPGQPALRPHPGSAVLLARRTAPSIPDALPTPENHPGRDHLASRAEKREGRAGPSGGNPVRSLAGGN